MYLLVRVLDTISVQTLHNVCVRTVTHIVSACHMKQCLMTVTAYESKIDKLILRTCSYDYVNENECFLSHVSNIFIEILEHSVRLIFV